MAKPHSYSTSALKSCICNDIKLHLKTFYTEILVMPKVFNMLQKTAESLYLLLSLQSGLAICRRMEFCCKVSSSKQYVALSEGTDSKAKDTWKTTGLACSSGKTCFPAQPATGISLVPQDDVITSKAAPVTGTESVQSTDHGNTQEAMF